jgi:hypothetical protein
MWKSGGCIGMSKMPFHFILMLGMLVAWGIEIAFWCLLAFVLTGDNNPTEER